MHSLFGAAGEILEATDTGMKLELSAKAARAWREGRLGPGRHARMLPCADIGMPRRPRLVAPASVPRRGAGTVAGRVATMHAVAHIEFNAINLAWDAVHRFRSMPRAFYADWIRIAEEEARHFMSVRAYLNAHDADYGDFDAHNGLWQMAEKTAGDVLERMALVPRVLEARGLDVTPGMIGKFRQAGDADAADILEVICEEEIGHVLAGTRWFRHVCDERGLDPEAAFIALFKLHFPAGLKGPVNIEARKQAGFTMKELERAREAAS